MDEHLYGSRRNPGLWQTKKSLDLSQGSRASQADRAALRKLFYQEHEELTFTLTKNASGRICAQIDNEYEKPVFQGWKAGSSAGNRGCGMEAGDILAEVDGKDSPTQRRALALIAAAKPSFTVKVMRKKEDEFGLA